MKQSHGHDFARLYNWEKGQSIRLPPVLPPLYRLKDNTLYHPGWKGSFPYAYKDSRAWGIHGTELFLDAHSYPHSATVVVTSDFAKGAYPATGFLIGPATVLTAGHVVLNPEQDNGLNDGWPRGIEVRAGVTEGYYIGNAYKARLAVVPPLFQKKRYTPTYNAEVDWALLTLDFPPAAERNERKEQLIGFNTGWFGLAALDAKQLPGMALYTLGYPEYTGLRQRLTRLTNVAPGMDGKTLVFEGKGIAPGSSGSPIFFCNNENGHGERYAVGVVVGATGDGRLKGVLFTDADLAQIRTWMDGAEKGISPPPRR